MINGELYYNYDKRRWVVERVLPNVRMVMKRLFTKISKTASVISLEDTDDNCQDLHWFIQRYPFEMCTEDIGYLNDRVNCAIAVRKDVEQTFSKDYVPSKFKMLLAPYEYQAQAADILFKVKRLLVGDDTGLGKTIIGIIPMTRKECLPVAIVVQKHLVKQWTERIHQFLGPQVSVTHVKKRRAHELKPSDVYIFPYSVVGGWYDHATTGQFKTVVMDEIQELRHDGTDKFNACKQLSKHAEYVLGLSATPMYNYADEMYNVVNLIKPGSLGNWEEFQREWSMGHHTISDPVAFGTYLRQNHLFLRRTRKDVGKELPPLNKLVYTVEADMEGLNSIEEITRTLAYQVLNGVTRQDRGQAALELDWRLRQQTGIAKAPAIAEFAKMILENASRVCIGVWHREVYDVLSERLKEYGVVQYSGSENAKQKDKSFEAFTTGTARVMLISLRSGVGLDGLQHYCNDLIVGELDWSPKVIDVQLPGRFDRDGQKNIVNMYILITDEGSDPAMIETLGLKNSIHTAIVDLGKDTVLRTSNDGHIVKLAQQILSKNKENT